MRKRELTSAEVEELLGVHDEIQAHSRQRGVLSAMRRAQLLDLHESGVTIPTLAEAIDCHASMVNKELARARLDREGEKARTAKKRLGITK